MNFANYLAQSSAAEKEMAEAHERLIKQGWKWDGFDGYVSPDIEDNFLETGKFPLIIPLVG